jgi:hypothetical protein
MLRALRPTSRHSIAKVDCQFSHDSLDEDSGLMLFSTHPFTPLLQGQVATAEVVSKQRASVTVRIWSG